MRRDSGHCRAQRAQRDSRLYRGHALGVTRFSRSGAVRLSIYMGYYAALGGSGWDHSGLIKGLEHLSNFSIRGDHTAD